MNKKLISLAIATMFATAGFAQTAVTTPAAGTSAPNKPLTVRQRKLNQQRRIDQGRDDGQLTRRENRNLEKKEHSLNQEERDMRKMDNGKLTAQDRKTLNQQQNKMSKQIYRDKHNNRKRG